MSCYIVRKSVVFNQGRTEKKVKVQSTFVQE